MASIRERATKTGETTWSALYRHGGKQRSRTFETEKAAVGFKAMVDALGPDRAIAALASDAPPRGITVSALAAQFLDRKARDVTPRTMTDYRRDFANWVDPWFGHREAEAVTEADVQKWVDHMATKLAPKSVGDRHMLLHSMYDFGRKRSRGLVTHNPCNETELPKRTRKPAKGTTVPEFRAILDATLRKGNPDAHDLILFLGQTGWRFSEATALDVRDVEDDGEGVWVTVSRVFRIDGHYRQVIAEDAAKSYAAFRRIQLPEEAAAMVRRRVVGKRPGDLVFVNRWDRPWNQNTFLRSTWPGILAEARLGEGRRPTPHWLRHMAVAVLLSSGATLDEVQRYVGHENIATTVDTYGRMARGITGGTLANVSAIFAGRRAVPGLAPVVQGEVIVGELDPSVQ